MQTKMDHNFGTVKYAARVAAEEILAKLKKGDSVQVFKTTQAGASTNILAEAADTLEEGICIIGPTTNSVTEVIKNAIEYCGEQITYIEDGEQIPNDGAVCGNIPGNDQCPKLQDLVTKHPAVLELALPLEECNEECGGWGTCPNSWMLGADPKILGVTKAKLAACLLVNKRDQMKNYQRAEKGKEPKWSLGSLQLREIRKAKTMVWDEAHSLEYPESKHLEIYNETDKVGLDLDKRFGSIINSDQESWKSLKSVIGTAQKILRSPKLKEKVGALIEKTAQDTKYSKLLSFKIRNPGHVNTHSIDELDFYMGVSEELIQLVVDIDEKLITDIRHTDVFLLRDLFYLIGCKELNLVQYRDSGKSYVGIIVIDHFVDSLLRKFIKEVNDQYHRNIFLSATYGEFNYNSLLSNGKKMKSVIFGKDGDPTGSCSHHVIIPDDYKLQHVGRNSLYARMSELMQRTAAILDQHGALNCVIIANSAREMDKIKHHPLIAKRGVLVDYYRSPHTMSTRYHYKIGTAKHYPHVMICIGGAETPTHCKDVYASNLSMSKRMRKAEIFQTLYQTWGRVKNRMNSLVYCLGINQETVEQAIRWGPGYRILLEEDGQRTNYKVGVVKKIASPIVRVCRDDEERLAVGREHLGQVSMQDIMDKTTTRSKPKMTLKSCRIVKVSPPITQLCKVSPVAGDNIELYTKELLNSAPILLEYKACTPDSLYTNNLNPHQENEVNLYSHICEGLTFTICHFLDPEKDEIKQQCPKPIEPLTTCKSEIEEVRGKAAIEEQLNIAIESIKISEKGDDYEDGQLFVWDCFCHCKTIYATQEWGKKSKHWDYYPVREYDRVTRSWGRFIPFTMAALSEHLFTSQTYGTYPIADDDTVITICWDIDAHFNKAAGMTEDQYQEALDGAETKLARLVNYLTSHGFDPKIEKSGSPGSYHVWLICKPVRAAIAHWFGNAILDYLGYKGDEMNPKQATIAQGTSSKKRANGYDVGNLVKLPLGKHKKNKNLSYILNDGYWMRYDVVHRVWRDENGQWQDRPQLINVKACDLSGIKIPAEAEPKKYTTQNNSRNSDWVPTGNMRPFVKWGLAQRLEGEEGHWFRVIAMYEALFNAGLGREQTIDLFRVQKDFDHESTAHYVDWVINSGHSCPYGPTEDIPKKVETMCPNVIKCFREKKTFVWTDYVNKVR